MRDQLDRVSLVPPRLDPQPVVVIADMTFDRRTWGVCVLRSPHLKKNLVWQVAPHETVEVYATCRERLESLGFKILAAVIDGKPGLAEVFKDVPVQMCQFHQIAIVTRYLTRQPKLPAGLELRQLALSLPHRDETTFIAQLQSWYQKWQPFLQEKSYNPLTRRRFYTHRRLRSAYRSLERNVGYLFTYRRYPQLDIPNTTNSLDGVFSHVKNMLRIHRGLKVQRKKKLIDELLAK